MTNQSAYRTVLSSAPDERKNVKGRYGAYEEEYKLSVDDPTAFWGKAAEQLEWYEKPHSVLTLNEHEPWFSKWFEGGVLNMSYNCLDVHVKNGKGDEIALIYDSPVTGIKKRFTYQELLEQVSTFAGALQDLGVIAGDRVVIYMPMIPEAAITMLACCRVGAIHSVVFGGFAPKELASRIDHCEPKIVVSASAGIEPTHHVHYKPLLEEALKIAHHKVQNTIIVQRKQVEPCHMGPLDLDFTQLMAKSQPVDAVPLPSSHYHHILYTSGTTGKPKGAVRETGPWAVSLKYAMGAFYDTAPGEVFWAASDIGWIVGHLGIYAPLLQGATTLMYEGKPVGTPDPGSFWRVIEEYRVRTFFVAPTAFRAIKQADPTAAYADKYDLRSLKVLFLAGEHSDPDTLTYCQHALRNCGEARDPIDHWWQTELGGPAIGNSLGLGRVPARFGSCTSPACGYDMLILNAEGKEVGPNELGCMVLKTPLPPGTFCTLYKNDERYVESYMTKFPGLYDTSDAAFFDQDGYIHIVGRVDDIINTAGHRLSTGAMEEIIMEHEAVADCAVFPVKDKVKGEVPVGLVVLYKDNTISHEQLKKEIVHMIREEMGPVAAFRKVGVVIKLPKTRSGKILRGTMSKIGNGEAYTITPTVEDPHVFEYLEPEIHRLMAEHDTH